MEFFKILAIVYLSGVILSAIGMPIYFKTRMKRIYNIPWDRADTYYCILCTLTGMIVWPIMWVIYVRMLEADKDRRFLG